MKVLIEPAVSNIIVDRIRAFDVISDQLAPSRFDKFLAPDVGNYRRVSRKLSDIARALTLSLLN